MILNAGSIVAPCMVVWWSPVKATTTHVPHGLEVEQVQSNLMTLLAARQASRDWVHKGRRSKNAPKAHNPWA
ncbi:MAG TPA: hypothetical protein VJ255_02440 [Candidatus Acidoferrum sp.]|nr:hypothetical protein [Candidatus Acidoferrum sp.]